MENILVSICVPVYNGEKFIEKTINSIIGQSYKNIEIIISDNGSTDKTIDIVRNLMKSDNRIKLNINKENLGFAKNVNKLIELSNSEYIAIYHADDIYEPDIVVEQIKYLQCNKELAGCFTYGKVINGEGNLIKNIFSFQEKSTNNFIMNLHDYITNIFIYGGSTLICPTSMIKKSVYDDIGLYNSDFKFIEDQDMYIRILEKYKIGVIAKELINYRIHSAQGSEYYRSLSSDELSVHVVHIKNYLDGNSVLKERYQDDLNKFISANYLNLVRNNIIIGNKKNVKKYIKISKQYNLFTQYSRNWILQNSNNNLIYFIVKTLLSAKRWIKQVKLGGR